jgi:hydroxymethylglutaryl-CoA synthase
MEFVRVRSVGTALPSLRLAAADVARAWGEPGGKGQVAVCADDEDGLTLAWTAAERALAAARVDAEDVGALCWGTSRPPYAEGPNHAYLTCSLGLSPRAEGALCAGSSHAGMEALLAGWDAVAAGRVRDVLVVASDEVLPGLGTAYEQRAGAAAVALLLSAGDEGATLGARASRSVPVLDRYRGSAEPYTRETYDPRLFREQTFLPVLTELGGSLAADGLTGASLPDPDGRLGKALTRKLGIDNLAADAYAQAGDTAAAAPLLGIAGALATPGEYGMLGYGGGRASGVTITAEQPVAGAAQVRLDGGQPASYADVLRARKVLVGTGETVPMGVPPGSAGFVRGGREMLQLLGARCVECGTVSTPPSIHPRCVAFGAGKLTDVPLARDGTVQTFATNLAMPEPFVAPLPLAVLDLDDGARLMVQVTNGPAVADKLAIGDRARLVLRRYAVERGAPVYGYKAERIDAAETEGR